MKTVKKEKTKKPLERHKLVLDKLVGNGGKPKSMAKALKEAGYSDNYANNPQKIKKTRSWDVLIKDVLNDELLAEKHEELIKKKEMFYSKDEGIIETGQPHSDVKGALDMAYKIKSKYAPEEHNIKFKSFTKNQLIDTIMNKITKKK